MSNRALRKGKGYERHIAKLMSAACGCNVRRTPCSGALDIKGDLRNLSGVLEEYVIECKKQERLNIWECIEQAKLQAGYKKWLLCFARNRTPDYVCLDLNDWLELVMNQVKDPEKQITIVFLRA